MIHTDGSTIEDLLKTSALYREFQAEREEVLRHKWIESEKAGYDIGFERALIDWIVKHRARWSKWRKRKSFLEKIQHYGINILVFSNVDEFNYNKSLPATEYDSKKGLEEITGEYESDSSNTLRKTGLSLNSPLLAGVFANEYQDRNH